MSQVEVSWCPSLSAYSPCSWWLSSAWTSECSAIFVFTSCEGDSLRLTPIRTLGLFPQSFVPPCNWDFIFQLFPSGICSWKMTQKWKNWKWTSLIYPQKTSLEECQKEFCQLFKYALYKWLHLSFTVTCFKMDHDWKCKTYTLHRLAVKSFYIMKPTFLTQMTLYVQKSRFHLIWIIYPAVHSIV